MLNSKTDYYKYRKNPIVFASGGYVKNYAKTIITVFLFLSIFILFYNTSLSAQESPNNTDDSSKSSDTAVISCCFTMGIIVIIITIIIIIQKTKSPNKRNVNTFRAQLPPMQYRGPFWTNTPQTTEIPPKDAPIFTPKQDLSRIQEKSAPPKVKTSPQTTKIGEGQLEEKELNEWKAWDRYAFKATESDKAISEGERWISKFDDIPPPAKPAKSIPEIPPPAEPAK